MNEKERAAYEAWVIAVRAAEAHNQAYVKLAAIAGEHHARAETQHREYELAVAAQLKARRALEAIALGKETIGPLTVAELVADATDGASEGDDE